MPSTFPMSWTTPALERLPGLAWLRAIARRQLPEWPVVRATLVELVRVAGVEGFAQTRRVVDLWDVSAACPEFAGALVRIVLDGGQADRLVVLNADAETADRLHQVAAAYGVADRVSVFLRAEDVLPFAAEELGEVAARPRRELAASWPL